MRSLTIVVAAFLGLHVAAAFSRGVCLWGLDSLTFAPAWSRGLFLVAGIPLIVLGIRRRTAPIFPGIPSSLDPWGSGRGAFACGALLVAGAGIIFAGLRSALPLLGDGQLHLNDLHLLATRNLGYSDVTWANYNAPLSTWIVVAIHRIGRPLWTSPETTYRVLSIGCGMLYVAACLPVSRILGRRREERGLILAFLLTAGYVQLFCGYVEMYALLMPLLLLYVWLGVHALHRGLLPGAAAAVAGVLVALHLTMVTLLPSLVLLAVARKGGGGPGERRETGRPVARGAASLGIAIATAGILLMLIGFDPAAYLRHPKVPFVPLLSEPGFRQGSRLLSPSHLLDVLNQYMLVAPAALLAIPFLRLRRAGADPERRFLLTLTIFPVLFTIVGNPEVGAFRDWDAFAYPALPLLLWVAVALARRLPPASVAAAGLLLGGAAGIHTLAWIVVNADAGRAEARFARLVAHCPGSRHARSYGWESLGSLYLRQRRAGDATAAFERAAEESGDNPRLWTKAGELNLAAGRNDRAQECFTAALALDADRPEASFGLGVTHFRRNELDSAVRFFERAVSARPDFARAHYNLGLAHLRSGRAGKAVESLEAAVRADPDFALGYETLGSVHRAAGRWREAEAAYEKALALDPNGRRAGEIRRWLQDVREARPPDGPAPGGNDQTRSLPGG